MYIEEQRIYSTKDAMNFLGCALNDLDILRDRAFELDLNDFISDFHKIIYAHAKNIALENDVKELDGVALDLKISSHTQHHAIFLHNRGIEWVNEVKQMATNSSKNYSYKTLKKFRLLREYNKIGMDIKELFDPNLIDPSEISEQWTKLDSMSIEDIKQFFKTKLIDIEQRFANQDSGAFAFETGEGILELIQRCKEKPQWGLPFQSKYFNTIFRGMLGKKYLLRSGSSGSGKTRQSVGDACEISAIAKYDKKKKDWIMNPNPVPSLVISTELVPEEIQLIMLATIASVPEETIKNGEFTPEIEERLIKAGEIIQKSNIKGEFIADYSIEDIENIVENNIIKYGIGYIFFDYIQVTPRLSRHLQNLFGYVLREDQMLNLLSSSLKQICNKYDVFLLSSTQLNRSYKTDGYVDATHLRGGMATADKCDGVIITLKATERDHQMLQGIYDVGFANRKPSHAHHIVKNRGGSYVGVIVWVKMDLDDMTIEDCFVTTQDYELVTNIKITNLGW